MKLYSIFALKFLLDMSLKINIITVFVIALLTVIGCAKNASEQKSESNEAAPADLKETKILFEEQSFDFGKIKQGDVVKHNFEFKNDGDNPLVITSASASCGCTVPQYPKDPVAPGEKGIIEVQFNSTGKVGPQNKTVTIIANTVPNTITLTINNQQLIC